MSSDQDRELNATEFAIQAIKDQTLCDTLHEYCESGTSEPFDQWFEHKVAEIERKYGWEPTIEVQG